MIFISFFLQYKDSEKPALLLVLGAGFVELLDGDKAAVEVVVDDHIADFLPGELGVCYAIHIVFEDDGTPVAGFRDKHFHHTIHIFSVTHVSGGVLERCFKNAALITETYIVISERMALCSGSSDNFNSIDTRVGDGEFY